MNKDEFNVNKLQKELAEVKDECDEALERIHVLEREARYHQQELDGLLSCLRKTQDERDALAAHVEESEPEELLICNTCEKEINYMPWHYSTETDRHVHACNECWPSVNATLKAKWQAEALESIYQKAAGRCSITITRESLADMARDLRRQAEGENND